MFEILSEIFTEFLVGIILWIFVKFIFYRFCYFTGMLLTPLVTFGKYYPANMSQIKELRQSQTDKGNKFSYVRGKRKYLKPGVVSLIGMIFYIAALVVAMIFVTFSVS